MDAPDLDIWKTGFGTVDTATQATGDANGDTNVDGTDFLLFSGHSGSRRCLRVRPQWSTRVRWVRRVLT